MVVFVRTALLGGSVPQLEKKEGRRGRANAAAAMR